MSSDFLLKFEGVSKRFCTDLRRSMLYGITDIGRELMASANQMTTLRDKEFWALRDVDFELRRGECLGLVGRNGAGKTTLLRLASGLIRPDTGRVTRRGRLTALIALGAGFNPILTGRENIYVNASVLGFPRSHIDTKIKDIIEFAEVDEFIDSPVQNYSSGMQVRLGFSIATAMDPDVLLIDEVLAVGDAGFRAKCFQRIGELIADAAVVFVSHDRSQLLRICDTGLLLDRGNVVLEDSIRTAVARYEETLLPEVSSETTVIAGGDVESFSMTVEKDEVNYGDSVRVWIEADCSRSLRNGLSLISFVGIDGMAGQAEVTGKVESLAAGRNRIPITLGPIHLRRGTYRLTISITDASSKRTRVHYFSCPEIRVNSPRDVGLAYQVEVS